MKRALGVFAIVVCAGVTTAFSRTVFAAAPTQVSGDMLVDLRTVFSVIGVVLSTIIPATWWLSRKFTRLDDIEKHLESIDKRLEAGEERFDSIEQRMGNLKRK